jgi:hypothetical protein
MEVKGGGRSRRNARRREVRKMRRQKVKKTRQKGGEEDIFY